ncbi:MAG: hypothetical protein OXG15_09935 [Gammaproteobacteria bacterium]|nr:hypothetical protein [Gammaproteobacteria bacterium]
MPESTPTMIEIYQRHTVPTSTLKNRTQQLSEPTQSEQRTPLETPSMRFQIIHMYVFPHRSDEDDLRIPGYWTSFELLDRVESRANGSGD